MLLLTQLCPSFVENHSPERVPSQIVLLLSTPTVVVQLIVDGNESCCQELPPSFERTSVAPAEPLEPVVLAKSFPLRDAAIAQQPSGAFSFFQVMPWSLERYTLSEVEASSKSPDSITILTGRSNDVSAERVKELPKSELTRTRLPQMTSVPSCIAVIVVASAIRAGRALHCRWAKSARGIIKKNVTRSKKVSRIRSRLTS